MAPMMRDVSAATEADVFQQSPLEEIANSITHGIGMLLSIAALVVLVVLAAARGNAWHVAGCSIFGATMVMLYATSTLYHSFPPGPAKRVLQILDHVCIYLLIAGTYTPFTLTLLRGPWGWTLFGLVWGITLAGVTLNMIFARSGNRLALSTIYVLMGWVALIALKPIVDMIPWPGVLWLIAGGAAYTFGVIFYLLDKRVPFFHAIWHLFVLIGNACHFLAVLRYVLPQM